MTTYRLFIAEKPSLARAIAECLPLPHQKSALSIRCGEQDVVAWCAGHIMELASPDGYGEQYKRWTLPDLPIIPDKWQLNVSVKELFNNLKSLLKNASSVVHAGDPDREGQLLIDEVLQALNYQGKVERLLINDLNPDAVKKALSDLKPNEQFRTLSEAAEARQKADWLYGFNMTRLYTLLGRAGGYDKVLSVGRVQTPLLGLIVRRDGEIEAFKPSSYYTLSADFQVEKGVFRASWQPSSAMDAFLDEEGRVTQLDKVRTLSDNLAGQIGRISRCETQEKSEPVPLPYSLADLQIEATQSRGLSAKAVLDIAQKLYETHKLVTYPRSDCRYLPEGHFAERTHALDAIKHNDPALSDFLPQADMTLHSRAWNDKQVTAHHGIIPTPTLTNLSGLSEDERAVYHLIATRYLMQFFKPMRYLQTVLEVTVLDEVFRATGKQIIEPGWQRLKSREETANNEKEVNREDNSTLPLVAENEAAKVIEATVTPKKTKPPERFTDATLIKAMVGIARFVTDPAIRQTLKETDGIGTPATQAQIIQTLYERQFIEKQGKSLRSTATGRSLIQILPDEATTPDMTAHWESSMRHIVKGEITLAAFLSAVQEKLKTLIQSGRASGKLTITGVSFHPCPLCQQALKRREGKNGFFWYCANRGCAQAFLADDNGKPQPPTKYPCTGQGCNGELVKRSGKKGIFWGCNEYSNGCTTSCCNDDNGKPALALKGRG